MLLEGKEDYVFDPAPNTGVLILFDGKFEDGDETPNPIDGVENISNPPPPGGLNDDLDSFDDYGIEVVKKANGSSDLSSSYFLPPKLV